jgi:hypothetical protein
MAGTAFRLTDWMKALRISDKRLSEMLDVAEVTVYRWRSGKRAPQRFRIAEDDKVHDPYVNIAKALTKMSKHKVSPADLWASPPEGLNLERVKRPGRKRNS